MKYIISLIVLTLSFILKGQLADVSFNNNNWTVPVGASIVNDELTIIGDVTKYIQVTLSKNIPVSTREVYFVAEVYLENIQGGPEVYKQPKFKTYKEDGTKITAFNIPEGFESKWFTTGVLMSQYDNLNTNTIKLEFAIQNASGVMKIRNPQLLDSPPTSSYTFPYDVPLDPSVSLSINTNEKHVFEGDLLSMNSHFTWSPYTWSDIEIKDVLQSKFPMTNARFPAGTVGNFYDWTTDGFYNDAWTFANPSRENAYNSGFVFDFPGYVENCLSLEASSTLMFNVIHDDYNKSNMRLQDRLSKLSNVKWVEMGNENYFTEQSYGNVENLQLYIDHTSELASVLKMTSPSTGVAVNIDHDLYTEGSWNTELAKEDYFDACVMHPYIQTNTFMLNAFSAKTILSSYKTTNERIYKYKNTFGDKPLLFTEWGILSGGTPVNFIQSLGVADMFIAIEEGNEIGVVKQAGIHMLYHSDNYNEATLIYQDDEQIYLTDLGVVYSKLFDIFKEKEVYNAKSLSPELETDLPSVNAKAVKDGDSIRVYVVNKLPDSSDFELFIDGQVYEGDFNLEVFSQPIQGIRLSHPLSGNPWVLTKGTGKIELPQYSISIISILNPVITSVTDNVDLSTPLYPNPTKNVVYLTNKGAWQLFNLQGRLIKEGFGDIIDLSMYDSGSYVLDYIGNRQVLIKY